MVNIVVDDYKRGEPKVEIVERKGSGHPDTIMDRICESASKALARYYLLHFKKIYHYNLDKGILVAGSSEPDFKGGNIIKIPTIIVAGRAATKVGNVKIPVQKIIKDAVDKEMARYTLPYELEVHVSETSESLSSVSENHIANDTSFGVGHYPPTKLEKLVLQVSEILENETYRRKFPSIGFDTKVMGVRNNTKISLFISIAFISRHIKDMESYKKIKKDIKRDLEMRFGVKVSINSLDNYQSVDDIYLTITGLSVENSDDGAPGRGNRYNDLITSDQLMSLESVSGKNIYHPGKLYQALSHHMAKEIVETLNANSCVVKIASAIGNPLEDPLIVSVSLDGKVDLKLIKDIVDNMCKDISKLQKSFLG